MLLKVVAVFLAFEGWWDILLWLYYKFTAKSVGERILKIDQYLAKLEGKYSGIFLQGTM